MRKVVRIEKHGGGGEEQEKIQSIGRNAEPDPDYAEEDEEDLDDFDTDGFIVDDPEYEEDVEEESQKQAQKKKKRLHTS
ncbi:hypothetical protein PHAVU_005G013700 [Phaseolus vulgaris]|uniref:Spt6 acidic N-terminal domain-containing protein n=1 Tax=Phaseolus vulgaris TaxID=3885 RepID=V7BUP6_PHAVU|nr:hypothetical protein PHAVU_005G013700g [Phaseolus vulgaris]ESW20775.1 hypothetical protein PHAVU_005G013700g [Phaseolus vulgaris]